MVVGYTKGKVTKQGKTWKEAKREKISTYTCRNLACSDHAYGRAAEVDEYVTESLLSFLSSTTLVSRSNDPKALIQAEKDLEETDYALEQFKGNRRAIVTLGLDEVVP